VRWRIWRGGGAGRVDGADGGRGAGGFGSGGMGDWGSLRARLEVLTRCQTRFELAWREPILIIVVKVAIECSNTKYLSIYVSIFTNLQHEHSLTLNKGTKIWKEANMSRERFNFLSVIGVN
jgi:hypothetical protein